MNPRALVLVGLLIAIAGGLVYANWADIAPDSSGGFMAASGPEGEFKSACHSHGNDRSGCNCAWREAEQRFQGAYMDLLIANISGNSAESRQIMGSGAINGFQFGANARQFSDRAKQRCDVFF